MFDYSSRSLKWLGTGASFVVVTSCFRYIWVITIFLISWLMCWILNCVSLQMFWRRGQVGYPSLAPFFHWFWSKPPNGVPLFYWLEKACSAYPRLTGLTFLFNIMWKGQLRDSPRLACFDLTFPINNSLVLVCISSSTIHRVGRYLKVFFHKFSVRPYWEIIKWGDVFDDTPVVNCLFTGL